MCTHRPMSTFVQVAVTASKKNMSEKRFAALADSDIQKLVEDKDSVNTTKRQEATGFDVNKDEHFSNSRRIFSAVLAETKQKGLGVITHKPPIAPEDLQKLYEPTHGTFSVENPVGLQCKVWFELMYYVCRRGWENLRQMTQDTFDIQVDGKGQRFVFQSINESDKNHRENAKPEDTIDEARMYEIPKHL